MPQTAPPSNHSANQQLYLYGASGHCKVIIDILEACNRHVSGIVDDFSKEPSLKGIALMGQIKDATADYIIAIGSNSARRRIASANDLRYATAVHPSAVVSPHARISEGTVVMAGAIVNSDAAIGRHCIVNSAAVIEHDCSISDFAHISPGARLAGNVAVGEGAHIGIGACVIQGVRIGKWAVIGAGAVVIRDVPDCAVVVGNPGRVIKYVEAP